MTLGDCRRVVAVGACAVAENRPRQSDLVRGGLRHGGAAAARRAPAYGDVRRRTVPRRGEPRIENRRPNPRRRAGVERAVGTGVTLRADIICGPHESPQDRRRDPRSATSGGPGRHAPAPRRPVPRSASRTRPGHAVIPDAPRPRVSTHADPFRSARWGLPRSVGDAGSRATMGDGPVTRTRSCLPTHRSMCTAESTQRR